MKFYDLLADGYTRISQILERSLKGLTVDDLKWLPHPESNSIGWLTWHLTRVQDDHIASLMEEEQLWIKDGWHTKFNKPADPRDRGFGDTPEQVASFNCPDVETLLAYHRAVYERSIAFFPTLSETDLDLIRRWVIETRIRWGIDGENRTRLGLPEFKENTWEAGLERLLLGYAMPGDDENLFKDLLPYDDIEGSETQVLGNLIEFTERLFKVVRSFSQPKSLKGWFNILTSLLDDFFQPEEETDNRA